MSLSERLAQQRVGPVSLNPERSRHRAPGDGSSAAVARGRMHQELMDILGPQLYDNQAADEVLEQRVRGHDREVLAREEKPLTAADRSR